MSEKSETTNSSPKKLQNSPPVKLPEKGNGTTSSRQDTTIGSGHSKPISSGAKTVTSQSCLKGSHTNSLKLLSNSKV